MYHLADKKKKPKHKMSTSRNSIEVSNTRGSKMREVHKEFDRNLRQTREMHNNYL